MSTSVQELLDYLLDVETTSELSFNEKIMENNQLYNENYLPDFEQIIENKFKKFEDFIEKERSGMAEGPMSQPQANIEDTSDDELEQDQATKIQQRQSIQMMERDDLYRNTVEQCRRLLQILYYCQQNYAHFNDLYFRTIDYCMKYRNEEIITMTLEQILLHLMENKQDNQEQKRFVECLSSLKLTSSQQEILIKIQSLLSIVKTEQETIRIFSSDNITEFYPYRARFTDVRQEFRDSTHYFIDGDSLLLSIAHHINVDLKSYYGNTLHVIYIIERILLILFNQSNQCNYTVLFFDCHHRLYETENSILSLIRACLIAHLSKNAKRCRIEQFSSWLNNEYIQFAHEEKPMFLFYHDMSNFNLDNDSLLSSEALEKLLIIYRLYRNYHQYYIQTNLYDELEVQNRIKNFSLFLILHIALLIRLSLVDRHLPLSFPSVTFSSLFSEFIIEFQRELALNLSLSYSSFSWSKVIDIFDGRLFAFTFHQIYQSLLSNIRFDSNTIDIIKQCLNILNIHFTEKLFHDVLQQIIESNDIVFASEQSLMVIKQTHKQQKITKISNDFIDQYLNPIYSSKNQLHIEWINPNENQALQYEGKYHWHRYKEVGHEIDRIRTNDEEDKTSKYYRYRTAKIQKFSNYFQAYGESLTNSDVKDNKLKIVLPRIASRIEEKKKQKKILKKEDIIKAENEQRMEERRIAEDTRRLTNVESKLKEFSSDNYLGAIDHIDQALPEFNTSTVRLRLIQRKFDLQRKYLRTLRKKHILTREEKSKFELVQVDCFTTMSVIVELENLQCETDIFENKKKLMEELIDQSPFNHESWYRFQMEKVNSRLPRREQGQPDDRISRFSNQKWNPDQWQVEFLNAVDQQQSVIIIAPTASGKTYASYYAMYQVIHDYFGPNGVCVYVAPTKALVNQVAATIYSKFGPVFGIFTRDFREQVETCRILVTVPRCLEILLLSTTHQDWCKRIQYCIFDEIHCMSSIIGSEVWERIMLLINCPMIGLSATVNNGQELCQWIDNIEQQRSILFKLPKARQVRFISYPERLADLNKYLYSNRQLHPIHPIGVLTSRQLDNRGLPKDFSLSPYETLQLNDAMQVNGIDNNQIPTLTKHFSPSWICERSQCNTYSKFVHQQFEDLISNRQNSCIDSIAKSLQPIQSKDVHYPESKPLSSLIVEFVLTLKEKDLLPCIVFTDNRRLCERMTKYVTDYLVEQERYLRETKYKAAIDAAMKREKQLEKTKKTREASAKKDERSVSIQDNERDDQSHSQLSGTDRKLLYDVLDECTFANRHGFSGQGSEKLYERATQQNSKLASYIKRGVAYHHAELFNRGRIAVEALFRSRYIQIVFSTSTLAMGIHMPTKTVAFINDSIYLDALSYRQSSGRAGRRGFDIEGNIVFIDIPIPKIRHLIMSAIPDIRAHFPTSVTFLMRLLQLCSNAKDKKDAINRSLISLQCPFISQISAKRHLADLQTRFHCLHTLDFLYQIQLIDSHGNLIGLAGLSTHLYYTEPANVLLVYLINVEHFHKLADPTDIITTLAHLFTNIPWLITHKQYETLSRYRRERKYNSQLFLPSMSNEFIEKVNKYNSLVKNVYGSYIENVSQQMHFTNHEYQEQILPFSGISFIQSSDYDNGTFEYNLHHHYSQQSSNPSISPFASVSGLTHERYMSNYNLSVSSWDLAYDLNLSSNILPFVDLNAYDHTNSNYHLNSYAVDFFKHGSDSLLVSENQLSPNDTNKLVTDFHLVLSSIKTSLEIIVKNEEKVTPNDLEFFRPLFQSISNVQEIFSKKFHAAYPSTRKL